MTSYIQLLNKIEAFCNAHYQIQRYGGEFREQMPNLSTESEKYPIVFVTPTGGTPLYDTNQISLDIYCVDIIQKNRANLNTIVSDCHLILTDLYGYFSQGSDLSVDVIGQPSQTPLNNLDLDYVAGWMMTIVFEVNGYCVEAIPMGDIPTGGGACEDATYIVEYADGTPIDSGTIPSGGSETIVVPNCPECEDATAEFYFDDELVGTLTIPCGDTDELNIGCSTLMNAVKVVSTWQQHKHGGTFKHIGEVNGKPAYEALHDPTKTIKYSGTNWQIIKTGGGAHVHNAANGNEAFPWLATWLDNYLTVTQATVGSFCTNGGIAYYNLIDTDGNLLAEGSISEGDEDNITAPDATVENSDSSYSVSILSGGSLVLPDSQINVNGVDEGDVVSVQTIDVNVTDGTNPVDPTDISLVGNTLTIEVPASGGCNRFPLVTGQTTVYETNDNGTIQFGREAAWLTLSENNPFGNTSRFTDLLGGSTYSDGVSLDWAYRNDADQLVVGWQISDNGSDINWADAIAYCEGLTLATYSDWHLPQDELLNTIRSTQYSRSLNYPPFNNSTNVRWWSSTTPSVLTTWACHLPNQFFGVIPSVTKTTTSSFRAKAYRVFTYAELGL
jgi:hypothetical protein